MEEADIKPANYEEEAEVIVIETSWFQSSVTRIMVGHDEQEIQRFKRSFFREHRNKTVFYIHIQVVEVKPISNTGLEAQFTLIFASVDENAEDMLAFITVELA